MELMFDATVLVNALENNTSRSGIFFTAYQIAKELNHKNNIHLSFYCPKNKSFLLKNLTEFKKVPIYPSITIFDKLHAWLRQQKNIKKVNFKKKQKLFWHYLAFTEKVIFFVPNLIMHYGCYKKIGKIDVFFFFFSYFSKEFFNNPMINKYIFLHDTIPLIYPEYYPEIKTGKYWLQNLLKQLREDSNWHAFANSQNTKKDFLKFVPELKPEQITVTPLACAENFHPCSREETLKSLEKYNLPTDKRYVFSLCSLEPRKNLIRAVKTFIEFIKKNNIDDMVFILGGGHWEDFIDKLNAEIECLGDFKNKIIKAGYIDDEDLAPLYSGAEWFVYTSQYEGFGLPPLEAMACGCPVITSNNSSLPEVVGDAGIMIDWDSDEQHIKAYENYYYHPELRQKNREKGLNRAKEFSWEKTVDLMVKEMVK